VIVDAPAKLNLCLYLGPIRDDGRHELRSIFEPLELADRIEKHRGGPGREAEEPPLIALSTSTSRASTSPRRRSTLCAGAAGRAPLSRSRSTR
jgi:4-diphosphocytidyl-2C-methyl-D-erythritol kinase